MSNIKTETEKFREALNEKLSAYDLNENDYLAIAQKLEIVWQTVRRYTSGRINEVRRFELAEKIIAELKENYSHKQLNPALS